MKPQGKARSTAQASLLHRKPSRRTLLAYTENRGSRPKTCKLIEAFKLALQSLWGNKLRSILTLIGVVMGVASVIMVITLVNGANKYVSTKLSGYGADVFTVTPHVQRHLHRRRISEVSETQDRSHRRLRGGQSWLFGMYRKSARCSKNPQTLSHNGHSSNNTSVRGYTWTMLSLNNIDIALGRGFTPADEEHATKNVIVGYDIVDNLLGDGDPIGKEIRVDGIPYTIVGVGDRQGKTLGQSQDNWVAVPITTYQQIYGYNDSVDIYARTDGDAQIMERAEDQVRVMMRTRRHIAARQSGRLRP